MEDGSRGNQLAANTQRVREIAVMAKGKPTHVEVREKRLDVSKRGLADGGVAHMADGHGARQAINDGFLVEVVANEAETALRMKLLAVEGDDAGRLLASMLKGVKPDGG